MSKIIPHITEILNPVRWDRYMASPAEFVEDLLMNKRALCYGGDLSITDQQLEILDAVANNRRVSVRAGRGVGKTAVLSWLTIWWLSMYARGRVVCTAPSFPQLQSVLWPEVSLWLKDSLLNPYFVHTAKKLYLMEDRENTFAEPRTASKEESAQGLHGQHLLVMMDEASGIEDKIYNVLEGSFTNKNNKIVLMTNPTRTSGFSYDSHNRNKRHWKTIKLSSENSSIVDKEWLDMYKDKYITGDYIHDMYKVHVLGEYPSGDPDAFIGLDKVQAAVYRGRRIDEVTGDVIDEPGLKDGPIEIGVDVARKGADSTVVCVRQGYYVYSAQELGLADFDGEKEVLYSRGITTGPEVLEMVYESVDAVRLLTGYTDIIRVKVDDTGLGGMGVTDYLELDREHDIEVIPCNFGGAGDQYYSNEATIMWGTVKEHIEQMHIPNDRFLIEELSTRRWDPDNKERPKIESKTMYKHDFGSSPDKADALVLAFADKQNERRFVKGFDPSSDNAIAFSSEELRGGSKFCALFCSPSHKMSAIWATWSNGKLRIFDEYEGDNTDIINIIRQYGSYKKIVGSANMFKYGTDDLATQYAAHGLFIFEQYGYDEIGAVNNMAKVAARENLIVAKECTETQKQLRMWTTNKGKTELKENYALCYAISHIVSELILTRELTTSNQISSYLGDKHGFNRGNDRNIGFMSM